MTDQALVELAFTMLDRAYATSTVRSGANSKSICRQAPQGQQ